MAIKTMVGFDFPVGGFKPNEGGLQFNSTPPANIHWGQQTVYGPMFSGKKLFELKATHGLPLDVAISKIFDDSLQTRIDWAEFIETARSNGWWDYQTIEVMEIALTDADVRREYRDEVLQRVKMYMLANPIDIATALVAKGDSNDR
jgi:hypothetical protein